MKAHLPKPQFNGDGTVTVWVDDEVMDHISMLRQPGESDNDIVRRLLVAVKAAREEDPGPPADGCEYRVRMSTAGKAGDLQITWEPNGPQSASGTFSGWLVTGDTYTARRDLRQCGGLFDHERGGYVLPISAADALDRIKETYKLDAEVVHDLERDPAVPLSGEDLRSYRNARRERKADRLEAQAANRDRDAASARAKHESWTSDYSFITEPIKIGHHSERRHRNLRDRISRHMDEEMRNGIEAEELRQRAEHLRTVGAAVKGDAEARYAACREAAEKVIRVGSHIKCHVYGLGRVVKANAKTWTVKFERGFTQNIDKGWPELVRHDDSPLPGAAFRKGDRVMASRFLGHSKPKPATIQRKTPRGYSVLIDGDREPQVLPENYLSVIAAE